MRTSLVFVQNGNEPETEDPTIGSNFEINTEIRLTGRILQHELR